MATLTSLRPFINIVTRVRSDGIEYVKVTFCLQGFNSCWHLFAPVVKWCARGALFLDKRTRERFLIHDVPLEWLP